MNKHKKVKGKLVYWTEDQRLISEHSIWLSHPKYPGYKFSPEGGCLSVNNGSPKLLIPNKKRNGYLQYAISNKGSVQHLGAHRIIAEIYCEKKPEHTQVNHISGVKDDNRASNLEWVTASENKIHSLKVLLRPVLRGSAVGGSKLNEEQVKQIKRRLLTKEFHKDIAKDFNVKREVISQINQGKSWKHVQITGE